MRIIFALLSLVLLAVPAHAASPQNPAYRTVKFSQNDLPGSGFSLHFLPDEDLCRKHYGQQWRTRCAFPLGSPGQQVTSIAMTPQVPGTWFWDDVDSLTFRPREAGDLKPETALTIDLSALPRPSFIKLDQERLQAVTRPLAATLISGEFLVDPSPAAEHRLLYSLNFNYPVPPAIVPGLRLPDGATAGEEEAVWSPDRTSLVVSWPVRKLPQERGAASLILPGIWRHDNGEFSRPGKSGTNFAVLLPGQAELFKVRSAAVSPQIDGDLNRKFVLNIELSLYAAASDLLNHLVIMELPEKNSAGALAPYNWSQAPGVSPEAIRQARKLQPVSLHKGNETRSDFQFAVDAGSDRYLLVGIDAGLASASGQNLPGPWAQIVPVGSARAEVGFLQPGNLLPLGKSGLLDVFGRDVDRLEWEVQLVREPFLALLSPSSYLWPGSAEQMDRLSGRNSGAISLPAANAGEAAYATLDLLKAISPLLAAGAEGGLVRVELRGMKGTNQQASAARLVLLSDLALQLKRTPAGRCDAFVHNLLTGQPVPEATVQILGANGLPVASELTDARGHARFSIPGGLTRERKPVGALAQLAGQIAWLPLNSSDRQADFSRFDISGNHLDDQGMVALVFCQRGIYRPGEEMRFASLLRQANFSLPPADLPLFAELIDPRGVRVLRKTVPAGEAGLAEYFWAVPDGAMSGAYTLNVRTAENGSVLGTASVRVEEFQPESLKLSIAQPQIKGWLLPDSMPEISGRLMQLYGEPAASHEIRATLRTRPAVFRLAGYENYVFTDPAPFLGDGQSLSFAPTSTGTDGSWVLRLPEGVGKNSSAFVQILVEGLEAGSGRVATAEQTCLISPATCALGYRLKDALTNLRFVPQGSDAQLEFKAVAHDLKPAALPDAEFAVSRRRSVTALVADGSGGYHYAETPVTDALRTWTAQIPTEGQVLNLDTSTPGEYLLQVRAEGRLLASIPYTVTGQGLPEPDRQLPEANMRLTLDRTVCNSGDTLNVYASLPYDATGLLSIERNGVEAFAWVEGKAGDNLFEIAVPENFEGKGYLVASFSRHSDSEAIHLSPSSYAVVPFVANMTRRDLQLSLLTPEKVRPGEILEVELTAREPGKAVIFAVDEGVLQLTRYQLPSPLQELLANRALDVATLSALDLVMPGHNTIARRVAAFGGGAGDLFGALAANPFKRQDEPPLAFWSGIVDLDPAGTRVRIPVPQWYNGQIRIMAVAAGQSRAGSTASQTVAVAPLVLTPAIPLYVAPGDEFEGRLVIANTSDADLALALSMAGADNCAVLAPLAESVVVPAHGEKVQSFKMRALDEPGVATLLFRATGAGETAERAIELSVRPMSLSRTTVISGVVSGQEVIEPCRDVFPQQSRAVATVSALPIPIAQGFAGYLDTYPYGCTEQLLSRSFSLVLLRDWPLQVEQEKAAKLLEETLSAIRRRFDGRGVALWDNQPADPLVTIYATDFLLTLREAGVPHNGDLLPALVDYLYDLAYGAAPALQEARLAGYAIWVLTRSGQITTQLIEDVRASQEELGNPWQNDLLGVFLAASQQEMHMPNVRIPVQVAYQPTGMLDEFAQYALHAAILARCGQLDPGSRENFEQAAMQHGREGAYATFSAAQGIRAITEIARHAAPGVLSASLECEDQDGSQTLLGQGSVLKLESPVCTRYILKAQDSSPLYWQVASSGLDTVAPAEDERGIRLEKEYLDRAGAPVSECAPGDVLQVRLTAMPSGPGIENCVIADLLPGGFELVAPWNQTTPSGLKNVDRQGDRVVLFGRLDESGLEYTYQIRATVPGSFATPPLQAQDMYAPAIAGVGKMGMLTVAP